MSDLIIKIDEIDYKKILDSNSGGWYLRKIANKTNYDNVIFRFNDIDIKTKYKGSHISNNGFHDNTIIYFEK